MGHTDLVGQRIREARRATGLTQAQLAEAVGVSRAAVAQWETGRTGQIGATLVRVAETLGTTAGALLEGSTDTGQLDAGELAMLRLFRACGIESKAKLLRTAKRLVARESEEG